MSGGLYDGLSHIQSERCVSCRLGWGDHEPQFHRPWVVPAVWTHTEAGTRLLERWHAMGLTVHEPNEPTPWLRDLAEAALLARASRAG